MGSASANQHHEAAVDDGAAAVTLQHVVKDYATPDGERIRVVDVPTLVIPQGAQVAFAGPSGSGKTTLFNLVSGLSLPTSGSIAVYGTQLQTLREAERDRFRARTIGYVFQTSNLLHGFSALENVLLALGFAGSIPQRERRPRAEALLREVGLGHRLDYRPAQLSSGQQQRVALARALANRPTLLLADEPTAHVDAPTATQLIALLRDYCTAQRATLLLASHDREVLAGFNAQWSMASGTWSASRDP